MTRLVLDIRNLRRKLVQATARLLVEEPNRARIAPARAALSASRHAAQPELFGGLS